MEHGRQKTRARRNTRKEDIYDLFPSARAFARRTSAPASEAERALRRYPGSSPGAEGNATIDGGLPIGSSFRAEGLALQEQKGAAGRARDGERAAREGR